MEEKQVQRIVNIMNYECNKSNLENSKWIKRLLFSHRPQRAKYERVQPQDMNITADATKEMRETWRRHATIKKEGNDRLCVNRNSLQKQVDSVDERLAAIDVSTSLIDYIFLMYYKNDINIIKHLDGKNIMK